MRKKRLSILLALIMVFTMLPATPDTVRAMQIVAKIGEQPYGTLQGAINAAVSGQSITLCTDTTEAVTINTNNNSNFEIDLNGHTLASMGSDTISHQGTGTLTIKDSSNGTGRITSTADCAIGIASTGSVSILGGVISSNYTNTINNYGSVSISGGTVYNTGGYTIMNGGDYGIVNISGGTVNGGASGAIKNFNSGRVNISAGTVDGDVGGEAIYCKNSGSVTVSGGTVISDSSSKASIINDGTGSVNISGGTVSGSYYLAIENKATGCINLSGGTVSGGPSSTAISSTGIVALTGGTVVIKGGYKAMNNVPDLTGYTDVQITASDTKTDGTGTSVIDSTTLANYITSYKYLKFTSAKITSQLVFNSTTTSQDCTNTSMHTQHIHADGRKCWVWDKDTATLTLDGIDLEVSAADSAISLPTSNAKLVLIGINTITLKNGTSSFPSTIFSNGSIEISGTGTLTINSSNKTGGTTRTVSSGIYTGGKLKITGGTIAVSGGEVSTTGNAFAVGSESYGIWGYGGVEITGGTVNAIGGSVSYEAGGYGYSHGICVGPTGISLSGGTVTAQTIIGQTPFSRNPTLTGMVLKTGTGTWDNTTGIACTYEPGSYYTAVTDITMTNADSVQVNTDLTLAGTVVPSSATNKTITWSVQNANGTGATISGSTFRATTAGTATIKATVVSGSSISSDYTKNFTITVTAPSTNNGGNGGSDNNGTSAPIKKEGKLEKDQNLDAKAPQATLKDSTEDLKAKVLSDVEQEQLAKGKDVKVILKVEDISTSVSAEDKKKIEEKLVAEQKNAADVALLYVDISLFKKVGDGEETKVTETNGKLKISIEVPESMWSTEAGADRTYRVIRMHNGVAEILNGTYDPATHLFTFETDCFSTYALTYQDSNTAPAKDNADTTEADQSTVVQDFSHLLLTAEAAKTSQKLTYAKVGNADGYIIYGAACGQEMKKLADVEKTIINYTVKKLKQGTYYKYQVKAYQVIDGKQVIIMISKVIHSVTEGKTYANPTEVTVDVASIKLAVGESKTVSCQVVLPEGKKLKQHTAAIRYESSNKKVVTVNSKGKITAKAKGTCYVYAYAQNGVYKRIKVTVK